MCKKLAILLLALAMLLPCAASGETLTQLNAESGCRAVIEDEAGLLSDAEAGEVLSAMMKITDDCNVGFYTYGGTSREYVMKKAKDWGEGTFPGSRYTLFIIDMATRQLAIYSDAEIYETITQDKAYTITDNVYAYASRREYAACAVTAFNQMDRVLEGENVSGPMKYISNFLLALLAAILLAYLILSTRMEQEIRLSLPVIVTATAGAGTMIAGKRLVRTVKHESSSGGGYSRGGHSGGGRSSGGHSGGGSRGGGGGSHGF